MRIDTYLAVFASACSTFGAAAGLKSRHFDSHDYFTLHLRSGQPPEQVARALGLVFEGPIGELPNHFYFSGKRGQHQAEERLEVAKRLRNKRDLLGEGLDGILWSRKQRLKTRMHKRTAIPPLPAGSFPANARQGAQDGQSAAAIAQRQQMALALDIADPIFAEQWHLFNTVELGHDVNVSSVWLDGITGKNATVAIIDDGLDMYSDDLKDNYFAAGSYDFNDQTEEPRPRLSDDRHGTRCAGEIGAVKNDVCGVGVAYDSKVAGIRILSGPISDEDEALAINYKMQDNLIYSCSWGPPDNGEAMDAPDTLIKLAIQNGVQKGRGGLGSVFVFAAGNGAANEDNCNFDGYTNSIYSITVGAIDRKGGHPYYSEKCSASLVVTYSSGAGDAIHTTDVGTNTCYAGHGGTSAAAPLGAGIFALVLSVRPDLNWRDLQYLVVNTAVPINPDQDWVDTYIGKKYSHTYAYGKLDAYGIVEAAKTWQSVKPQAWYKSPWQHVKHDIPQGDQGLASRFEVTKEMLQMANLERLEHVTITMNVNHTRRGDLSVELISPHGIVSHLSATRRKDQAPSGYVDWTFMSVVHWGEPGVGNWTVIVKDTIVNEHSGIFTDWRMILWGEAIDEEIQELYPLPTDHDDDDHNLEAGEEIGTIPANVGTTSVFVPSSTTLMDHPTDHPDRPVNNKPGMSTTSSTETHTSSTSLSAAPFTSPTTVLGSPTDEEAADADTPTSDTSASPPSSFFLPSIFPTFGVSPRTQIWIYGAVALILIFCIGLGAYFLVQKRRRQRRGAGDDRADYEFEVLNEEEELLAGNTAGRQKRRAGELYDAFAGESEEEAFFSDENEDAQGGDEAYRDDDEKERPVGRRSNSEDRDDLKEK